MAVKMEAMMKACTKPHAIAHMVSGAGLGILIVGLIPSLAANAATIGVIVLIAGVVYDFAAKKGG